MSDKVKNVNEVVDVFLAARDKGKIIIEAGRAIVCHFSFKHDLISCCFKSGAEDSLDLSVFSQKFLGLDIIACQSLPEDVAIVFDSTEKATEFVISCKAKGYEDSLLDVYNDVKMLNDILLQGGERDDK